MSEAKFRKPKFLTDEMENNPFYHSTPDPYRNPPAFHYNLRELDRYSKRIGKEIIDMTTEEIEQFRT